MLALSLLAADTIVPGDRQNAAGLYRLHCAGCHGESGVPTTPGRALGAQPLRDPQRIGARSDDQLIALVLKGAQGHPALGSALTLLDAADLVAFLRSGLPAVGDVFPEAAAYTAKSYTLPAPAVTRAETLAGSDLTPAEKELTVFTVYGGERPQTGARLVPQDPVLLDELSPRQKRGYVVFGEAPGLVALGLGPDLTVAKLVSPDPQVSRVAPAVLGKGGRGSGARKPFVSKAAPEAARALTRLYARAVEACALAAKEDADRHLFDTPEAGRKPQAP